MSSTSSLVSFNPIPTALPTNLGKLATRIASRAAQIGFFPACAKARGPLELQYINLASHRAAALLDHTRQHGLPISLQRDISEEELRTALHYGAHSSAKREVDLVHQDLADQVQAGHIVVFLVDAVLYPPKLWLSPVSTIPQVGRRSRLIFEFTWSGLNESTARETPKEVMSFGGTLRCIIRQILRSSLWLGLV